MNNIQVVVNQSRPTMSSVELVDVINSMREDDQAELAHSDFLKKVEKVIGVGAGNFSGTYRDVQGKSRPCYHFPKREASLMVMSESYAVQAKVYDRMAELESAKPATVSTRTANEALDAIRKAKAMQMNIESANTICARFPHLVGISQQVIYSKLIGGDIIPLPRLERPTYTATQIAEKFHTTPNMIGRIANTNGLKTEEFGIFVLDKSASSDKQVETFRYNDAGVARLAQIMGLTEQ